MNAGSIAALVFVSIPVVLCCLATLYEGFLQLKIPPLSRWIKFRSSRKSEEMTPLLLQQTQEPEAKQLNKVQQTVLCFSFYSNSKKMMNNSQPPGAITSINGIRFLSMSWVILGHTIAFYCQNRLQNFTWIREVISRFSAEVLLNATVSVDSFFVLSGLLVAYLFLRDFARQKITASRMVKATPMIYLQRYLRLTPAYGFMILFWSCLLYYVWDGPLWPNIPGYPGRLETQCVDKWYLSLLYVNNIFDVTQACAGWGWYLSNDFQFFLIAPFLLFIFYKHEIAGLVVSVAAVIGSTIAAFVVSYQQETTFSLPYPYGHANISFTPPKVVNYNEYDVPWARYQSYGVGLTAGMILWKFSQDKVTIPWLLNLALWGISAGLCISVLYGPYDANIGGHVVSLTESVFYVSLSRLSWSLGVSYVIISCHLGQGGWINEFLSWGGFVPLSRLTYCSYLIHIPIISVLGSGSRSQEFYTEAIITKDFLFILVVAMGIAFPFSMVYEMPFVNLDKLYLTALSIKKRSHDKVATTPDTAITKS